MVTIVFQEPGALPFRLVTMQFDDLKMVVCLTIQYLNVLAEMLNLYNLLKIPFLVRSPFVPISNMYL